jgi:HAD superfamily hydrolase (TIGR01509 family)
MAASPPFVVQPGIDPQLDVTDAHPFTPESAATVSRPAAVLWDMDGTLVDTEPYWIDSEFNLAERHGAQWSREQALNLVGRDLLDAGRYIREHMGIDLTPEQIVDDLLDGVVARVRTEVPWRPGALDLLATLRDASVPCALVTMSYQRFVAPILEHLAPETFRVVVTGDVLTNGKPHPEPYLTAAAALGVAAADCIAIEDSSTGVTSAETAGCMVLVVPNHVTVSTGSRRIFRDSLVGIGLDDLSAMCRR